jgi:hypothetical protein
VKTKEKMTLKDIDSSKLLFDINAKDLAKQVQAKFPELSEYEGNVDIRKVCIYIILMADMFSPMSVEKPDWWQRKYACALLAGFPRTKKEFTKEAEQIIIGEDMSVNRTMVAYTLSFGLPNFALLQAYMALMSFEMQKVFGGSGSKDSQKIIDGANDRIQSLTRDFFKSGDTDEYSKVRQILYSKVEKEREKLRPEQIIRTLENDGELPPDFNPYSPDYKIDLATEMIFIGDDSKK